MEREYTKSELKWIKEFKSLMRRSPKNLELIVTYGGVEVWEAGSHYIHLMSEHNGYAMSCNPEIEDCFVESLKRGCLYPYSEGA